MKRISRVGNVLVTSLVNSSISLFGDSAFIAPRSEVFAAQREQARYLGNEGNLEQFPLFQQPMPKLHAPPKTAAPRIRNASPYIDVRRVNIRGLSASAVFHVGNTGSIDAETRIKHVRQLLSIDEEQTQASRRTWAKDARPCGYQHAGK